MDKLIIIDKWIAIRKSGIKAIFTQTIENETRVMVETIDGHNYRIGDKYPTKEEAQKILVELVKEIND